MCWQEDRCKFRVCGKRGAVDTSDRSHVPWSQRCGHMRSANGNVQAQTTAPFEPQTAWRFSKQGEDMYSCTHHSCTLEAARYLSQVRKRRSMQLVLLSWLRLGSFSINFSTPTNICAYKPTAFLTSEALILQIIVEWMVQSTGCMSISTLVGRSTRLALAKSL